MQITLEQARERLSAYQHAFCAMDIRDVINNAIQALAGLTGWEHLRRVVRLSSASPVFALPQGCAGLVRVCANGRPATVRGQDFQFLQSGPGDLGYVPDGFFPLRSTSVVDLGRKPVMVAPVKPYRVFAYSEGADQPCITVKGLTPGGSVVRFEVPMQVNPEYDTVTGELVRGSEPPDAEPTGPVLLQITEVTLDRSATDYITLYSKDEETGDVERIAVYHPSVRAPSFRHYTVTGLPPNSPVDLLVETRIDPLPLVHDTDVLPFDSVEPLEYMVMYMWKMQSSEIDAARKYKEEAASWLKAQEVTNDTVQGPMVVNVNMIGSMGEISMDSDNI